MQNHNPENHPLNPNYAYTTQDVNIYLQASLLEHGGIANSKQYTLEREFVDMTDGRSYTTLLALALDVMFGQSVRKKPVTEQRAGKGKQEKQELPDGHANKVVPVYPASTIW
jgi:hypothetical protein